MWLSFCFVVISAMHASICHLYFISDYSLTIRCQRYWKSDICVTNLGYGYKWHWQKPLTMGHHVNDLQTDNILQKWNPHTRKHITRSITWEYGCNRFWYMIYPNSSPFWMLCIPATRGPAHFVCGRFCEPNIMPNLKVNSQLTWIWGISLPASK